MLKLKYKGSRAEYDVAFEQVSKNIVQLKGDFPARSGGFYLSREGKKDKWDYLAYDTVYKTIEGGAQFSNDGSVWIPKVKFYAGQGGELSGDTEQSAYDYADLDIPEPQAAEDYEFSGWQPEIPAAGQITSSQVSFTAMFVSTLPPAPPEPTELEILEERMDVIESVTIENYENQELINQDVETALIDIYETIGGI